MEYLKSVTTQQIKDMSVETTIEVDNYTKVKNLYMTQEINDKTKNLSIIICSDGTLVIDGVILKDDNKRLLLEFINQ